jgi:hypothetical protein
MCKFGRTQGFRGSQTPTFFPKYFSVYFYRIGFDVFLKICSLGAVSLEVSWPPDLHFRFWLLHQIH